MADPAADDTPAYAHPVVAACYAGFKVCWKKRREVVRGLCRDICVLFRCIVPTPEGGGETRGGRGRVRADAMETGLEESRASARAPRPSPLPLAVRAARRTAAGDVPTLKTKHFPSHFLLQLSAVLVYIFCGLFSKSFVANFVAVVVLLMADFWMVR